MSAHEVDFYDTALYHQQSVKWLAEHGLVTGIALLHWRLGLTSSWFAMAAPLNHGFLAGRAAAIVGGLPFTLIVLTTVAILWNSLVKRSISLRSLVWITFGTSLTAVSIAWNVGNSLSPDPIIWLLPAVIVTVLTGTAGDVASRIGGAMTIAAMATLVKLNSAPALGYCAVIAFWHMLRNRQDRLRLSIYFATVAGVLVLLITANIKTSGCPMFPSPVGCISAPWSVGHATAAYYFLDTQSFALSSRHWQTIPLLLGAAVLSFVAIRLRWATPFVRHGVGLSAAGIAFLLITAPSPRFGMGYLIWPLAIGSSCIFEELARRFSQSATARINGIPMPQLKTAITWTVPIVSFAFAVATARSGYAHELLYPRRIASTIGDTIHVVNRRIDSRMKLSLQREQVGTLTVWNPTSSDQCWDAPLPCTPKLTFTGIGLRNEAQGFVAGFMRSAAREEARNEH
jgi:hypothetical protein